MAGTDSAHELRRFQRSTRDRVCKALLTGGQSPRFLVADEVGLGKTRVAQGVVAKISQNRARGSSVVVYLTANAEIARQNAKVLRGHELEIGTLDRLTLLAQDLGSLRRRGLHVLALSPQTSLSFRGGGGITRERALLLRLVRPVWRTGDGEEVIEIFRVRAGEGTFWACYDEAAGAALHAGIANRFRKMVARQPELKREYLRLRRECWTTPERQALRERAHLMGRLRRVLAHASASALKPHLVVLDEFQRFRWVLNDAMKDGTLARQLLSAPTLLLSATPYRMRAGDAQQAHEEFAGLMAFLHNSPERGEAVARQLDELRSSMEEIQVADGRVTEESRARIERAKARAERSLRRVMSRWERPQSITEGEDIEALQSLTTEQPDAAAYLAFQKAVDDSAAVFPLRQRQTVEYWKSAPYLANFMRGYKFKQALEAARRHRGKARGVVPTLKRSPEACLKWSDITAYRRVAANNARLRYLQAEIERLGAPRTLWVPPTLSPYESTGPFAVAEQMNATKVLVFSGWAVVPRALAGLTGYEAERTVGRGQANTEGVRRRRGSRNPLALTELHGSPRGTSALLFAYPSQRLASVIDPYEAKREQGEASLTDALSRARQEARKELRQVRRFARRDGRADDRWYWAGPMLIDQASGADVDHALGRWGPCRRAWQSSPGGGAIDAHLRLARRVLAGDEELGAQPANLASVMAEVAIGGPGTCAYRALAGLVPDHGSDDLIETAARIGWGLRTLLNRADAGLVIRGTRGKRRPNKMGERPFWRDALRYCCAGSMQGVLDEYLALVAEEHGAPGDPEAGLRAIRTTAGQILELQPLRVDLDDPGSPSTGGRAFRNRTLSSRFSAAFGRAMTDDKASVHPETVRQAFNSPFWPWVLITTSVGQEGLDFHRYCHALVHWNVPAGPVELEQREGRVNRYKSHAVRKNIAATVGGRALQAGGGWPEAVKLAAEHAANGSTRGGDFSPEWIFDGPNRVEPVVPVLASSRDQDHYLRVLNARVYYRLVLGQPNPNELVQILMANLSPELARSLVGELQLDLRPR